MNDSLIEQTELLLSGPRPLPLVYAGEPVLRRVTQPYDWSLPADLFAELLHAMQETMLSAPGVGLAAPQVGLGIAVAVIEDSAAVPPEIAATRNREPVPFRVLVNPAYLPVGVQSVAFYEGCLSVPGYQAVVPRAAAVHLRAHDERRNVIDEQVTGWAARIVQHETDHLNGTLYLDKALTRSLSTNETFVRRWATPTPDPARAALGF